MKCRKRDGGQLIGDFVKKFIPYTITTGFTAGIAVTIVIGQIKDLTPEANANAMESGRAIIATITPATTSFTNCSFV